MKNVFKTILKVSLIVPLLVLAGCESDLYEKPIQQDRAKKITLADFRRETRIANFQTIIRPGFSQLNKGAELSDFVVDTAAVQKFISANDKATYSFRVYPLSDGGQQEKFFNLVYTKTGNAWEQAIMEFKMKETVSLGENQFEDISKIYDSKFDQETNGTPGELCFNEHFSVQCDGSCQREGYPSCDGFSCPTGQCVVRTITVGFCGGSGSNPGIDGPTDSSGGGSVGPFEFSPNLFDNPAFDDQDYINAVRTQQFFSHLTSLTGAQQWIMQDSDNRAVYNQLVHYQILNRWSAESEAFAFSILNDLTADTYTREQKNAIMETIRICGENNASFTIDNSVTPNNSRTFNDVWEFEEFLNNRSDEGIDFTVETPQPNQKIVSTKFWVGLPFNGVKVNVKQNLQPNYSVSNVTSELFGLTPLAEWHQSDYSSSIQNNIVTVDIYGVFSIKIFFEGIGTVYHENQHFQIKINKLTGEILSATVKH